MTATRGSLSKRPWRVISHCGYARSAAAFTVTAGVVVVLAVVPADAGRFAAQASPPKPLTMDPITATFNPEYRETRYRSVLHGSPGDPIHLTWTLHLELVDPAGTPAPGEPGSAAAVDPGCNNAGSGLPNKPVDYTHNITYDGAYHTGFTWHHPDLADSIPPGEYHCNHLDMGPRGHQGLITVVIRDSNWECGASYKGTNSTSSNPLKSPTAADIAASVKNGTASTPKCSPIH